MDWTFALVAVGVVVAFLLFKQVSQISGAAAREHLRQGAVVVDVRSRREFESGHLARAINIPVDELETGVKKSGWNTDQVILLHCLSGGRSALAARALKRLGYRSSYNLGSYGRAKRIVEHAQQG